MNDPGHVVPQHDLPRVLVRQGRRRRRGPLRPPLLPDSRGGRGGGGSRVVGGLLSQGVTHQQELVLHSGGHPLRDEAPKEGAEVGVGLEGRSGRRIRAVGGGRGRAPLGLPV